MGKVAYCFLDTETTGLQRDKDEVWSASWSFDQVIDGKRYSSTLLRNVLVEHSAKPSAWTMARTDYLEYFTTAARQRHDCDTERKTKAGFEVNVLTQYGLIRNLAHDILSQGCKVYLVGANPAFDAEFLERLRRAHFPTETLWDYHLLDIEAMAMGWAQANQHWCATTAARENGRAELLQRMAFEMPRLKDVYFAVTGTKLEHTPHSASEDRDLVRQCFWEMAKAAVR